MYTGINKQLTSFDCTIPHNYFNPLVRAVTCFTINMSSRSQFSRVEGMISTSKSKNSHDLYIESKGVIDTVNKACSKSK